MGATHIFSFGSTQRIEPNSILSERLLKRQSQQQLWTQMSLISLSLGFLVLGTLIMVHPPLANWQDLSSDSPFATVGGLGAILVGLAFTVAACHHWRARTRRSPLPEARRDCVRLAFSPA
jgi:hypothetical protein